MVINSLPVFWDRLEFGGVIIFDQYNFDIAPGEACAIKEILPGVRIKRLPWSWMPTAYVIKE